ncbi:MAG: hypothetical protein HC796_02445 [Synechococcaceae cyanobacterium RL_1_2]|nr:hypothetical protein [Synechococcaceae cyanobacterium RL_1_2]
MQLFPKPDFEKLNWSTLAFMVLGFWLSASLILDLLVMPSFYAEGMMQSVNFISVLYSIFSVFNRVELVCGGLILTSVFVFTNHHDFSPRKEKLSITLALVLIAIAATFTYLLTPELTGMGLSLGVFERTETMPQAMVSLQSSYWVLEAIKLIAGLTLVKMIYQNSFTNFSQSN